jgi:ribonucleoside-diphosphate reductase beta chain
MGLLDARLEFEPVEYPEADIFWLKQQTSHWLHTEIQLGSDKDDWLLNKLTDNEKAVIGSTLKGFTQTEVIILDMWRKVASWFKKPEIQAMAATFSAYEGIHQKAYAYLQRELGLNDFNAFLQDPAAKNKIDRLMALKGSKPEDIARGLAVFSAFNEGVNLFSSFAILMSFSRRNLLKNVGQIVEYSIRDEALHSQAGCWLFRTLVKEYPELMTDELKEELYEAARQTVKLEDAFIDQAFSLGEIPSINSEDLKAYMRFRTNTKLKDIGLSSLYRNINKERLANLEWFDVFSAGVSNQDFFAGRVTEYSKGVINFDLSLNDEAWT